MATNIADLLGKSNNAAQQAATMGIAAEEKLTATEFEQLVQAVQENQTGKIGILYYDPSNNRYIAFANEETRDEYIADPTKIELILGTFDAPFNYTAEISLFTDKYVAVKKSATGNYIKFSFDIKNKQGASTGENVTIKVTFTHNASQKVLKQIGRYGEVVTINIDDYLSEGENTIMIGITGQSSLAATTTAVTYRVVDLELTDEMDISACYDLSDGAKTLAVPFSISGYGTKVVEWYLDGQQLEYVKNDDEVVETQSARTKYITLDNLSQGTHSLVIRAYTTVNGEKFYTDTLYRDIIISTGSDENAILGIANTVSSSAELPTSPVFVGLEQYVPYTFRFATYSPVNQSVDVTVKLGEKAIGQIISVNDKENTFTFTPTTSGDTNVTFTFNGITKTIVTTIEKSSLNINEITSGLALDFNTDGRSNDSSNKNKWTYGDYTGEFSGFNWNNTSGWVDNRLLIADGCTFATDYTPLTKNATTTGKTLEFEFMTYNVIDDDAVVCDITDDTSAGLKITATQATLNSANGVQVSTRFRTNELVRISFVINRSSGSSRKGLAMVYCNGIPSGAVNFSEYDTFASTAVLKFVGTNKASVALKNIRIYDVALTDNQIFNNMVLYRDTVTEMMDIYNRNDIYLEGSETISPEKCMSRLPVVLITGDIPVLENTSDKNTQIIVDVEYYNVQDPDRNFTMKNAAMRPQGTSSMGYPKKNFRLYTKKLDITIVYDANGDIVEDRLYSFKDKAQPVNCWCFKADYAESSGTHNTGIARMWNDALYNVQLDGKYVCRTEAQKAAIAAKYDYDVRTTIDGFPVLMFYRLSEDDSYIFIGKYNFNNDKSTESVFGFKGVPGFDNSKMQCWEVLNNGNDIALFNTASNFDNDWGEAFESRYPDTEEPDTTDLKAFCEWMVNVTSSDFVTQKWEHFNVYMMAAYYVYLMRFAAADQFVKNAMFTSEDGQHFYYILYDNDTINGLINTGRLAIEPEDDRQSVDPKGGYLFAGHESRLWNMLEADAEFMDVVQKMDNALYSAGISYKNCLKYFDTDQADKWAERIYMQDAEYKYLGPYTNSGINNLFMLQGKRDLHRKWFLATRFAKYDAKFVTGTYKSQAIEMKVTNGTEAGQTFTVTAGYPSYYGYGVNSVPITTGVSLDIDESTTFDTKSTLNLGDPIRIYNAARIKSLDLKGICQYLTVLNLAGAYSEDLGTSMQSVSFDGENNNVALSEISGLNSLSGLTSLNLNSLMALSDIDLSALTNLQTITCEKSGLKSIKLPVGAPISTLSLPSGVTVLELNQLPQLSYSGLSIKGDLSQIKNLKINSCPNLSTDFTKIYNWVLYHWSTETTVNNDAHLVIDNIDWKNVDTAQLIEIGNRKKNGADITLKGKINLSSITEEGINALSEAFGVNCFTSTSSLYITAPDSIFLVGPDSILEGESAQFKAVVFSATGSTGTITYSYSGYRSGTSFDNTGKLTTTENGAGTVTVTLTATYTTRYDVINRTKQVTIKNRVYPTSVSINGDVMVDSGSKYTWSTTTSGVNGKYVVSWRLSGDITNNVEISSSNDKQCILNITTQVIAAVNGSLTLTVKKAINDVTVATASKDLTLMNEDIVMTSISNPIAMSAIYNAGISANSTYLTKEEAALVTSSKFGTIMQKSNLTTFDEFKYFTNLTEVPKNAFLECKSLSSISLPPSIISFGDGCFYNCIALTSINISNSVTSLGSTCFYKCESLTNIDFSNCTSLASIGNQCFSYCTSFTNIDFSNCTSLASIGASCFSNCKSLTNIDFSNCTSLASIGDTAFYRNYLLTSIKLTGCTSLASIGKSCFYECDSLTNLDFSDTNLTSISGSEFYGCSSIATLSLPASLTSITQSPKSSRNDYDYSVIPVFPKLTSVTIDAANTTYDSRDNCNAIIETATNKLVLGCSNTTIPSSVTAIGDYAFWQNTLLTFIDFTNCTSLVSMGINAFYGCTSLKSIDLSHTSIVNLLGNRLDKRGIFEGCTSLESFLPPLTLKWIDYYLFEGCTSLKSIDFSNCSILDSIGGGCFKNCTSLTSLTFPSYLQAIGDESFYNCKSLASINFSDLSSLIYIAHGSVKVFYGCESLTSLDLSKTQIKYLDGDSSYYVMFGGCTNLTSIKLPASLISISASHFRDCNLTSVTIDAANTTYDSRDNCNAIIETATNKLVLGCSNTTIPSSVTAIGGYAFAGCKELTSIVLPSSITSFGIEVGYTSSEIDAVFYNCTSLKSVDLSKTTIPILYGSVFYNCTSLEEVKLPSTLVGISNSLWSNNYGCFYNCTSLRSIDLSNCTALTTIGYRCFYNCTSLSSINIPDTVTSIGVCCFCYCESLISIKFPSLKTIGDKLFAGCSSLKSVDFSACTSCSDFSEIFKPYDYSDKIAIPPITSISLPSSTSKLYYFYFYADLKELSIFATSAPSISNIFYGSYYAPKYKTTYTGQNSAGENVLYVPAGATGYDTGYWLDPLQNASKCGFTISYTL